MQRLYIGYVIYTYNIRCGIIEKLLYDRCCRYTTHIHGLYFNNLTYVFHTKAGKMHMRGIYTSSFILYSLFIKYFKFIYKKKNLYTRYIYTNLT